MAIGELAAGESIPRIAEELKKNPTLAAPSWVGVVKSGPHAERVPAQKDFWYIRLASILRTLYLQGNVGVRRLRHKYGGRKRHTVARAHHTPAGGKMIRAGLQSLERAGLLKKEKVGRTVSAKGVSLLTKAGVKVAPE